MAEYSFFVLGGLLDTKSSHTIAYNWYRCLAENSFQSTFMFRFVPKKSVSQPDFKFKKFNLFWNYWYNFHFPTKGTHFSSLFSIWINDTKVDGSEKFYSELWHKVIWILLQNTNYEICRSYSSLLRVSYIRGGEGVNFLASVSY